MYLEISWCIWIYHDVSQSFKIYKNLSLDIRRDQNISWYIRIYRNISGYIRRYTNVSKFRSRRWGSSLPCLRLRDPPLSPPSTWGEILRHPCLQSGLQTSPPVPQKSYPMFQPPTTTPCRVSQKLGFWPPNLGLLEGVGGQGGSQNGLVG